MKIFLPTWRPVVILAVLALVAACSDNPTAPGIEPEIVNSTDAFSYQLQDLRDVSGSWDYTWQNTGTVAKITHASNAGSSGTATLVVRDAVGTQVYSGPLLTSGEPLTSPVGIAGAWTISIVYSNYSNAQVNFDLSKQ